MPRRRQLKAQDKKQKTKFRTKLLQEVLGMLNTNLASILGWLSLFLQAVLANFKAKIHDGLQKIGRASCRERV